MTPEAPGHRYDVVVIGGGQAGLAVGYYLKEQGRNFTILDAGSRVGDAWRGKWDSLRLFTPAGHSALPGMPFPAPRNDCPTRDEMADYLQRYAREFGLPVRLGRRIEALVRCNEPAGLLRNRLFWWLIDRVTADTRLGRKAREFDRKRGTPLVGLKPEDIARAGVERVPRVEGVADGNPELADGRTLKVGGVVWATGFEPDFGWIKLTIFDEEGYPIHHRGVVDDAPGLYFVGLPFQHTFASAVIGGVGKDARYVAAHLASRAVKKRKYGFFTAYLDVIAGGTGIR